MSLQTTTRLTYDDYVLIPDDGQRHEIIDGEHYVNPAPSRNHQHIAMNLVLAIGSFVRRQNLGRVYFAPFDVVLSRNDVLQPDLLFVTNEREALFTDANLQGAPNLVIEILSPSSRVTDRGIKRKRYDRFGVDEYWIVDPADERITVYRREKKRLREGAQTDPITSPLLPDFTLPLRDVFAE